MSFPWRTLTVISLAINLLIVGAAVGFFMSHFPRGGPPFGGPRGAQGMGLRALPDAERSELARALTGAWQSGGDLREAAQQARQNTRDAVGKDPYDEAAVRKALAEMRAADNAVLQHYQEALASSLGKLSSEQRLMALRAASRPGAGGPGRLFREGRRGPGGGRGDGDGPPPEEPPPR
jgi:uncharacterized membrane protein